MGLIEEGPYVGNYSSPMERCGYQKTLKEPHLPPRVASARRGLSVDPIFWETRVTRRFFRLAHETNFRGQRRFFSSESRATRVQLLPGTSKSPNVPWQSAAPVMRGPRREKAFEKAGAVTGLLFRCNIGYAIKCFTVIQFNGFTLLYAFE